MTINNINTNFSDKNSLASRDNVLVDNTKDQAFSILDNLGFEDYKNRLGNYDDLLEILNELGNKASFFFSWYILYSDASLKDKNYYLSSIERDNKRGVDIFSDNQLAEFAKFIFDNNLITYHSCFKDWTIDYMQEDLLRVEYIDSLVYYDNLYNKVDSEHLIDFIFENYNEFYNFLEKKKENTGSYDFENSFRSLNSNLNYLVNNKTEYFFKKLNSLKQDDYESITQNLSNNSINSFFKDRYIDNNSLSDNENKEIKEFLDKLSKLGLEKIQYSNTGEYDSSSKSFREKDFSNNYFNILYKHNPDLFKNIDINKITSGDLLLTSYILDNIKDDLFEKFKESKNIDSGDIINKYGKYSHYTSIFGSDEFIDYAINNFTQDKTIDYLIFLNSRCDFKYGENFFYDNEKFDELLFSKTLFSKTLFSKISIGRKIHNYKNKVKEDISTYLNDYSNYDKKLRKILKSDIVNDILKTKTDKIKDLLQKYGVLQFIKLYRSSFKSFSDILNSKQLNLLLNNALLGEFIILSKYNNKIENIDLKIDIDDINNDFISFFKNNLPDISDSPLSYRQEKINIFFDFKIDKLGSFSDKSSIENNIFTSFDFYSNLEKILSFYPDFKLNLTTCTIVEKEFNIFLGNDSNSYMYLSDFLKNKIDISLEKLLQYFKKTHKKDLDIYELLLVLKDRNKIKIDNEIVSLLDKQVGDFDSKNLILIDGNKIKFGDLSLLNKIEKMRWQNDFEIKKSLKKFDGWTIKSFKKYLKFVEKSSAFCSRPFDNYDSHKRDLAVVIGNNYTDYSSDHIFKHNLNKYFIQSDINKCDFKYLDSQIKSLKEIYYFEYEEEQNLKIIKEKIEDLFKYTKGYLSEGLLRNFIFSKKYDFGLEEIIENFEIATGMKLKAKDLKTELVINLFDNKGIGFEETDKKSLIILFFEKFPNNAGKKWKISDIEKNSNLKEIFRNFELSYKLADKIGFNILELKEIYGYEISSKVLLKVLESDDTLDKNKFYYYVFKKLYLSLSDIGSYSLEKTLRQLPVNRDNFLEYMEDEQVLFQFDFDKNLKNNEVMPWSKAWFLEDKRRLQYLDIENIRYFQAYGTIIGLGYMGEDPHAYFDTYDDIELSEELQLFKDNFGLEIADLFSSKNDKFIFRVDLITENYKKNNLVNHFKNEDKKNNLIRIFKEDKNVFNLGVKSKSFRALLDIISDDLYILKHIFNADIHGSKISGELSNYLVEENDSCLIDIMKRNVHIEFKKLIGNTKKYDEKLLKENQKRIIGLHSKIIEDKDNRLEKLGIKKDKLELSLYARYHGQNMNYPEIVEYIILFLERYIGEGYSAYFSSIRIIPREPNIFPSEQVLDSEIIDKYSVVGDDFKLALHAFSIPLYFSHSTNSSLYDSVIGDKNLLEKIGDTPSIISNGMKSNKRDNDILSELELEEDYDKIGCDSMNLSQILKEVLKNIRDVEKQLDKI